MLIYMSKNLLVENQSANKKVLVNKKL